MNRIDDIKNKKGLTYLDIAESTGLTSTYIWALAKNKRHNPSKEAMEKIAHALGETVTEIFFADEI